MSGDKQIIKEFLNKCSIVFDEFSQLDGMLVPRDILLSKEKYELIKDDIEKMKKLYSSGSLTALQKNAFESQKCNKLPKDNFDVPLNSLLNEKGFLHFKNN